MTLAHGNQEHAKELRELVKISAYRTIEQDPAFGIRQIVDVALKALSPAINDTTTAVMCIDYLGAILAVVAPKTFPPLGLCRDARLRVLTIRPDFAALVREPFDQIRRGGGGNLAIIDRMSSTIEVIGSLTKEPERLRALAGQLDLLDELSEQTVAAPSERVAVRSQIAAIRGALAHGTLSATA